MPLDPNFIAVVAIVFFAFFTQAATGFGGMVIALTISALLFPVPLLLGWFVPLVILISSYLLIRHHAHINWSLFFKKILPAMGVGLLIGQLLFYNLQGDLLKKALGVLIVALAARELLRKADAPRNIPLLPWTFAAGIAHGVFATGGPLLVYGLNGQRLPKSEFRSTLALVWLVMAVVLLSSYIGSGQLTTASLPQIGILAATLPFSIALGEWVHSRINAQLFQRLINALLVFCGIVLLVK